jgi:hypothetical protein
MGNTLRKKQRAVTKQRNNKTNDDDFPLWGVQLSFLKEWTQTHVKDQTKTTSDVCQEFILPLTKKKKSSMIDLWGEGRKHKANRFISHSWSYSKF